MTRRLSVTTKKKPLMPYLQLLDYIKTRYGYGKFVSAAPVRALREDYPRADPEYVMSFVGSGLAWLVKKGYADRDKQNPANWWLLVPEDQNMHIVEASSYGVYIVDIADYEVLLKSVEPHQHKIKELISSDAHVVRTRLLAAALSVPYRILRPHIIAEHREGRWFIPPDRT